MIYRLNDLHPDIQIFVINRVVVLKRQELDFLCSQLIPVIDNQIGDGSNV